MDNDSDNDSSTSSHTERIQVEGEEGTDHTHEVTTAHHNHAANSVLASR